MKRSNLGHEQEPLSYNRVTCSSTYTYFRPLIIRIGLRYHLHLATQRKRKKALLKWWQPAEAQRATPRTRSREREREILCKSSVRLPKTKDEITMTTKRHHLSSEGYKSFKLTATHSLHTESLHRHYSAFKSKCHSCHCFRFIFRFFECSCGEIKDSFQMLLRIQEKKRGSNQDAVMWQTEGYLGQIVP